MVNDVLAAAADLGKRERLGVVATVVAGPGLGAKALIDFEAGIVAGELPDTIAAEVTADAGELMQREQNRTLDYGDYAVYIETIAPDPHLLIFGAVHIAQPLTTMAKMLGFTVTVVDSRPAFTTAERFPDADAVHVGWPDQVMDRLVIDRRTYVAILAHDARFEDPVFPVLRERPVRYIGAMGSRRTHKARAERLAGAGWSAAEIERIHGPIGLDIGARSPSEIAVSILAEITASLRGTRR